MQRSRFFSLASILALAACGGNPGGLDGLDDAALANSATVTFQKGASPSTGYAGVSDTTLVQSAPSTSAGSTASISVDGDDPNGTKQDDNLLLRFDVSAIPAGSTVSAVTLKLFVTNNSVQSYPLYALTHVWMEAGATWNTSGSGGWNAAGATGSADHGSTSIGTLTAATTGSTVSVKLNAAGVALVQQWVNDASTNHGLIALATNNYDKASFASSEASTASQRPALSVTYAAPTSTPTPPASSTCFPFADPSTATLRAS